MAAPTPQSALYTVQKGDTWLSIAFRFGVPVEIIWQGNGVVNPSLLAPGQQLFIPKASTREPTAGSTVSLSRGKSLLEVAAEADTMLTSLQAINRTQWPFVPDNQQIYIPDAILHLPPPPAYLVEEQPLPAAPPAEGQAGSIAVVPAAPAASGDTSLAPLARSRLGVQGNFLLAKQDELVDRAANGLGAGWVKQQIIWNLFEPAKGTYREEELAVLDGFVDRANGKGLKILLSVTAAPDWARPTTVNHGPPADYNDLADFMGFLAGRYRGRVQAYEVWNEPNTQLEWTDFPISGTAYVNMLSLSYAAIKAKDPGAIVISAGLAPASDVLAPDGTVLAVDDRQYLRDMYAAGVANYADAIGIHPYGAGNPPDASHNFGNPGAAPSHNNHPSFFFQDNVNDYRVVQGENGDGRPLWATEFGWPSPQNIGVKPEPGWEFMNYVTEEQQADYIYTALLMAQQWDFMGPMFIYILNFGPDRTPTDQQRAFAILSPTDSSRPAFRQIKLAPKY
jgi:LysM repeat protein